MSRINDQKDQSHVIFEVWCNYGTMKQMIKINCRTNLLHCNVAIINKDNIYPSRRPIMADLLLGETWPITDNQSHLQKHWYSFTDLIFPRVLSEYIMQILLKYKRDLACVPVENSSNHRGLSTVSNTSAWWYPDWLPFGCTAWSCCTLYPSIWCWHTRHPCLPPTETGNTSLIYR